MTAENEAAKQRKRQIPASVYIIGALVLALALGFLSLERYASKSQPQQAVLTPEAKAYVRNLKLDEVQMKATEAYLKQTLVEITGKITNAGDRRLRQVDIHCVFYDPYGQVVLREKVSIVRQKTGGLSPGETKPFRLPFDNIPESWNQAMPQMVIAQILFE